MTYQNATNGKAILSQTDRIVGRSSAGGGISEEIVCTAAGRALIDDADSAAQRTTLGLGTASTLNTGTSAGDIPLLDANGLLVPGILPTISLTSIQVVADQASRLALSNVQPGDVAKQTDNGISYILSANPASTNSNWISLGDTSIDASEIVSGVLSTGRGGTGLSALGSPLQNIRVNATGTALEFFTPGASLNRLPYNEVSSTSVNAAADNSYGLNNASQIILTLPSTSAVGSQLELVGIGAGGWRIAQLASQQIHFGNLSTTVGTGGRLDSSHRRDSITLKCVVANLEWVVTASIGNLDVV